VLVTDGSRSRRGGAHPAREGGRAIRGWADDVATAATLADDVATAATLDAESAVPVLLGSRFVAMSEGPSMAHRLP
jgi:hypothetical protein